MFTSFYSEAYMNITVYFNVIEPIYDFFDDYKLLEDETKEIIGNFIRLEDDFEKEFFASDVESFLIE